MEQEEKQFTQGFNNGYLIAKHEPGLYSALEKGIESKNDYLNGFLSGGKEYEIEKQGPAKEHPTKAKDRSKDIEKDR